MNMSLGKDTVRNKISSHTFFLQDKMFGEEAGRVGGRMTVCQLQGAPAPASPGPLPHKGPHLCPCYFQNADTKI